MQYEQLEFDMGTKLDLALRGWQGNALPFINAVKERVEAGEDEGAVVRDELQHRQNWFYEQLKLFGDENAQVS